MPDMIFYDPQTKKQHIAHTVGVVTPSGAAGYRIESVEDDEPFSIDWGTIFIIDGELKVIHW